MTPPAGNEAEPEPAQEPQIVCSGLQLAILMVGDAFEAFNFLKEARGGVEVRQYKQLRNRMDKMVQFGAQMLPDTQFKSLGKFPAGDQTERKVTLFEIKVHSARFYGVLTDYKGQKAFISVEADLKKKQSRSDQKLLARAAKKAAEYI